jgi:hypothetical protein
MAAVAVVVLFNVVFVVLIARSSNDERDDY